MNDDDAGSESKGKAKMTLIGTETDDDGLMHGPRPHKRRDGEPNLREGSARDLKSLAVQLLFPGGTHGGFL